MCTHSVYFGWKCLHRAQRHKRAIRIIMNSDFLRDKLYKWAEDLWKPGNALSVKGFQECSKALDEKMSML